MAIVHLNKPYIIHVQIRLKLNRIPFQCQFKLFSLKHLSPFPSLFFQASNRIDLKFGMENKLNKLYSYI